MYRSPVLQRSPLEEDDRLRGDKMSAQHLPAYTTRSPPQARYNPYPATNGSHQRGSPGSQYPPQTPTHTTLPPLQRMNGSPRPGPPTSPTAPTLPAINGSTGGMREAGSSTYYDPTSDNSERNMSWKRSSQPPVRSPIQVCHFGRTDLGVRHDRARRG
jgi:hypothetical protein